MPATLETLEKRLIAVERKVASMKQQSEPLVSEKALFPPFSEEGNSREKMLAAMEKLKPISDDDADMINETVMDAGEQSIYDQAKSNRRESVMSLRAKLKPISQEDADLIRIAIMESREMSVVDDPAA